MKILTVVGARPQFIKASALSMAVQKHDGIEEVIVHTGQHYDFDMSGRFFEELNIPSPKYTIDIGKVESNNEMVSKMMLELEKIIYLESPDYILVYGDTNSTLAAAMVAGSLRIKIVHVEAGLRSHNWNMPEEYNRVITDVLSEFKFAPNVEAFDNLKKEGISASTFIVGDIMVDTFEYYKNSAPSSDSLDYAVMTIHRAVNVNKESLINIFSAVSELKVKVIFPAHPRTLNCIIENSISVPSNVDILNPVSYKEMVHLLVNSRFVITDSGGLQKEAYMAKKLCFVIRDETEWKDIINTGWGFLVSSDNMCEIISKRRAPNSYSHLFGVPGVAEKIVQTLKTYG